MSSYEEDIPSLAERPKIVKDQEALAICQIFNAGSHGDKSYLGKHLYLLLLLLEIQNSKMTLEMKKWLMMIYWE